VFELPFTGSANASAADLTLYGEEDVGGLGYQTTLHDFNSDGYVDLLTSEPFVEVDGFSRVGRVLMFWGPITTSSSSFDRADWVLEGPSTDSGQYFGYQTDVVGDVDGDGVLDWSAPTDYFADSESAQGGAWLFTHVGSGTTDALGEAMASVVGVEEGEKIGSCAAGVDLDADGHSDWVVGARSYDNDSSVDYAGGVLVLNGPVAGDHVPGDADLTFIGENSGSSLGDSCVNLGDVNLDGYEDLLVGADQAGDGAAYIVWGSNSLTDMPIADADVVFRGDLPPANFGYTAEAAGDLNEDGWNEIIVGDSGSHPREVYIFYGPFTAAGTTYASSADITLHGDGSSDGNYQALIATHDVTGDDVIDVLVGSWEHTITSNADGIFYIVPGIGY
jgi:hypothetical protein